MGGTTAKLVDAPTFDGRSIAATLPRSEVEQAIAGKGDVSLKLEVKARPEGAADFEAHTLEIDWDKADLERMLEQASGDQVTLTFDAGELADMIEPDVEGHALRERVAVLTVAVAAATAGTASYVATTTAHHENTTPAYAYVHSAAPIEQVSDAASGGGYAQAASTGDAVSRAVANQEASQGDVMSRQMANQTGPAQVSDAATGGYSQETVQGAEQYAGYQHSVAPTPELASDAATGGYTQDTGDVVSRQVANQPTPDQVSDAASGGGYAQETVQGAQQYGGYVHPTAAADVTSDAASGGGYTQTPEMASDAATGGYTQQTVQGAEQYAGYQHSAAPSVAAGAEMTDVHNVVSDAAAGGAAGTELRSDASTGGYTAPTATPSVGDSGTSFDTPGAPGLIAGGIALLITGAALVTGKSRRKDPKPA